MHRRLKAPSIGELQFAEVFATDGGFDVALANPPYVQLQTQSEAYLANQIPGCRSTMTPSHAPVMSTNSSTSEAVKHFKRQPGGLLSLHYLQQLDEGRVRQEATRQVLLRRDTRPLRLLDLGKDVFETAIVDSGVLVLRTGREATNGARLSRCRHGPL